MRTSSLLLISALALSGVAAAETLSVHKSKARQEAGYPTRGQVAKQVIQRFGEPKLRHAPVGGGSPKQPPITRWDYEDFSVFFDAGHVIDTVVKDQPPEISHKDELQPAPQAPTPPPVTPDEPAADTGEPPPEPMPESENPPPV